jgi:hypothetical protein
MMPKSDQYKFMIQAFQYVFSKIPSNIDSPLLRKDIAEAMLSAEAGNGSLADVRNAGLTVLNRILFPPRR